MLPRKVGGESGKVHSTVRERWARKDPGLVAGMAEIASLAEKAQAALLAGEPLQMGPLMERNFAIRRSLYGDEVVGAKNIAAVELAKRCGMSAKFTGSGGALVCLRDGSVDR